METNLTVNVGYFSGPASLNTGEIVGISITMILVIMIILVIIAVLVLKVRPGGLRRDKQRGNSSHEMSFTTVEAAHNGSVVINGTTYTASNSGSSSGLTNGYINPDVIPAQPSPQTEPSVEMVQNRLNSSTAGSAGRYENLPLPVTSVGVEAAYSPNLLGRNSIESDRSVWAGGRFPLLLTRTICRLYGGPTVRENYTGFSHHTLGAVNDCFSDESGGSLVGPGGMVGPSPPMFHRDLRLYSDYYAPHVASTSPFFHGTLPKHFSRDWVSSPLRLPDWRESHYPADYGLPIPRGSLR